MKEFVYNGKPQRLSKITAEYYPLFSYNAILKLIKDKEIRVDGAKVGEDVVVNGGSVIRCYAKDMRLKEIYRDENILIVYKPKGLKSEGDISAESILAEYEKGAILCHRLDTNTDGLLIFALNVRAAEEIAKGFKNEKIEKVYEARVYGKVPSDAVYRDYLLKNAKEGKVRIFQEKHAGAVPVEASVKVIGYDKNSTLVEVVIHNGKTHQIRAQLAAHGHFILGDGKYGRDDINNKFGVKKQQLTAKKLVFSFDKGSFLYYFNGALDFLKRLFFNSRNITSGNSEFFRNFALRQRRRVVQAVPHHDYFVFALVKRGFDDFRNFLDKHAVFDVCYHAFFVGRKHIDYCQFVAVAVGADGIVQRYVVFVLFVDAQSHQYFVFDALRRVGRKGGAFPRFIRPYRFDKSDTAD